jgi:hypothetical protein
MSWNLGGRYNIFSFHCQYADTSSGYQWDRGDITIFADGDEISRETIIRDNGLLEFSYDISGKNIIMDCYLKVDTISAQSDESFQCKHSFVVPNIS